MHWLVLKILWIADDTLRYFVENIILNSDRFIFSDEVIAVGFFSFASMHYDIEFVTIEMVYRIGWILIHFSFSDKRALVFSLRYVRSVTFFHYLSLVFRNDALWYFSQNIILKCIWFIFDNENEKTCFLKVWYPR